MLNLRDVFKIITKVIKYFFRLRSYSYGAASFFIANPEFFIKILVIESVLMLNNKLCCFVKNLDNLILFEVKNGSRS